MWHWKTINLELLVNAGMASPAAFAQHENMTMTMDDNMSSMGNMTGGNATSMMGDNATSMAGNMTETESLPSAGETGYCYTCVRP